MTGSIKFSLICVLAVAAAAAAYDCPEEGVFSDTDINYFWSCTSKGDQGVKVPCRKDTGFIRNGTYTGCIPFSDWQCTFKDGLVKPDCKDEDDFNKLHHHLNPNHFWACPHPSQGHDAVLMECPEGRGFTEDNEYYGCVDWADWKCSDLQR